MEQPNELVRRTARSSRYFIKDLILTFTFTVTARSSRYFNKDFDASLFLVNFQG